MKTMVLFALAFFPALAPASSGPEQISAKLQSEFRDLRALVQKLEPEFMVGGYLFGKRYGDHELLWHLASDSQGTDTIRLYREKSGGRKEFAVAYLRSTQIVEGRTVIRRFVGPVVGDWRNDTIDANSGEYLGSQGVRTPELDARDREILRKWKIELFE